MVCGLRNDKTPEVTSRETCLPALFLENKSRFMKTIILWLWKWIDHLPLVVSLNALVAFVFC